MSLQLKANKKGEVTLFLLASDTESGTEVSAFADDTTRQAHWQTMLDSGAENGPEEDEDWQDFVEEHRKSHLDTFQDDDVQVTVLQLVQIRDALARLSNATLCLNRIKEIMQWTPPKKPKKLSRSK